MINVSEVTSYNANTGEFTANIYGTDYTIGNVSDSLAIPSSALASSNLYIKKDGAAYTSPAKFHQDHPFSCWELNPFNIKDINVIVPGKVMVVTFEDNRQEKLVCQEEDHFSLRFGCFIAIAKHLYKDTYTSEGIEHMATEMSYQIHYVKIVNKALKNYSKKCEEKEKEKRLESEKKEAAERKKAKREAYKERRKAKLEAERNEALKAERAEMVNIIAEAIKKSKE